MPRIWLLLALLVCPSAARAFSHSETTDGELSADNLAPSALVAQIGANTLTGSTVSGDLDYVRVTLPSGGALVSLILDSVTSSDDLAFMAVQEGPTFTVTPATATQGSLLGFVHFGTGIAAGGATPGNDILDDMGAAFGVIGFTPPLLGTDYTFWIQQTSPQSFGYSMTFVVTPEPGTAALMGLGLLGFAIRRRKS